MSEPVIAQLYADDAAYPNHWIALSDANMYFLIPKGEGAGAWYSRVGVTRETVAMHLYPIPSEKAHAIITICMMHMRC